MVVFVLVVLLIAAIFGILGAVLKAALVIALSLALAFTIIAMGTYWYVRHRVRRFVRDMNVQQRGYPTTGTKRSGPSLPPE